MMYNPALRFWIFGSITLSSSIAPSDNMGPCQHGACEPARFCTKSLLLHAFLLLVAAVAAVAAGAAVTQGYTRCRSCSPLKTPNDIPRADKFNHNMV